MRHLVCGVLIFILWLILTWSVSVPELWVGAFLAVLISIPLSELYPPQIIQMLNPRRWLWLVLYIPYFFYYCAKANFDVAYRVLHPDVPIRPGIVKVRTELNTDMGKTFLANSITLTPGTLSVDIHGQELFVHWINVSTDKSEEQTRIIVKRFERMLKGIFE